MEKVNVQRNPDNDLKFINGLAESMDVPAEYLDPNTEGLAEVLESKNARIKEGQERALNDINESAGNILEYFTE